MISPPRCPSLPPPPPLLSPPAPYLYPQGLFKYTSENPQAGATLPIKLHLNMMREMDKCIDVMQKSFSEAHELKDTPMPFP